MNQLISNLRLLSLGLIFFTLLFGVSQTHDPIMLFLTFLLIVAEAVVLLLASVIQKGYYVER